MFEETNPSPAGGEQQPPKPAEDIFDGVDTGAANIPRPEAFQAVSGSVPPVEAAPESDNKKYFILGILVLGIILIGAGGWYGFTKFSPFANNNTDNPTNSNTNTNVTAENPNTVTTPQNDAANTPQAMPSEPSAITNDNAVMTPTSTPTSTPEALVTNAQDTDNDGLLDSEELAAGTNINLVDTDNDGLYDYDEVKIYKTDPLKMDTDGDTYSDGQEVKGGYNPVGEGKLFDTTNPASNLNN